MAIIGAVFFYALPKMADFSEVWAVFRAMTWLEVTTLVGAAAWNIFTYWFVMIASLPGSNIWQAMKVNLMSTAVTNTLPGGSAIGIAVTYSLYSSYGFSGTEVGLSIVVSGLWNNFVKLGMPVVALALLALTQSVGGGLVTAAIVGVGVLAGAIALFALSLKSERFARRLGERMGRIVSGALRIVRKPAVTGWGDGLVRFRESAIALLRKRWLFLTAATVVSHLSLFLVLLLCLRHVGVSSAQVTTIEALAAFAFIRLISAIPITPGGLGVVELGMSASLVAAGGNEPAVVAAVLLYRLLTYVLPIPFGLVAYIRWRSGKTAASSRSPRGARP